MIVVLGDLGLDPAPFASLFADFPVTAIAFDEDDEPRAVAAAVAARDRAAIVVGTGFGGGVARMAAVWPGFVGCIAFGGAIVHPTLSAHRPTQPLDLIAGLRVPVQAHFGEDPAVDRLEERLRLHGVVHQVFRYAGVADGFADPASPAFQAEAAGLAHARAMRFVEHLLRLPAFGGAPGASRTPPIPAFGGAPGASRTPPK